MVLEERSIGPAKVAWVDPRTDAPMVFVLAEGATATIGRQKHNDICIPEGHVSRQHAVINYRDGLFFITDLESSNGTFVNDERISAPFPLASGDEIRLHVPTLTFSALVTAEEQRFTAQTAGEGGRLIIATGIHEGDAISLTRQQMTVGRATNHVHWDIALPDEAVSRPHARLEQTGETWVVYDLGSANGTFVNEARVNEKGHPLRDGDTVKFGSTLVVFRAG